MLCSGRIVIGINNLPGLGVEVFGTFCYLTENITYNTMPNMQFRVPDMISVRDLQRNYRKTLDRAKSSGEPVIVLRHNKPETVIVDIDVWQNLVQRTARMEEMLALKDIAQSEAEYQVGQAKKLKGSLLDLVNEG